MVWAPAELQQVRAVAEGLTTRRPILVSQGLRQQVRETVAPEVAVEREAGVPALEVPVEMEGVCSVFML